MKPADDNRAALAALEDVLASLGAETSDPEYVVVQTEGDLERLARDIVGERDRPIVGLAHRVSVSEPVLRCSDIRTVVGPHVRIYLLSDPELLGALGEMLGPRLRLEAGSVRIWWPGANARSDRADHPLVVGLEDEDYLDTLAHFAHEYHLSRPLVRDHVRVIEDARACLEHEIVRAQEYARRIHERLRDAQIECHALRTRAEAAEARAAAGRPE